MEKILIFYSGKLQVNLPSVIISKYQVKIFHLPVNKEVKLISEFKPQLILYDEFVPIRFIKRINAKYPFIPFAVLGEFNSQVILDKILSLGFNVIKLPVQEQELVNSISNLLWFSLAREELWNEEEKLAINERKKKYIFTGVKIFLLCLLLTGIYFGVSTLYSHILQREQQKLFREISLPYNSPSDIVLLNSTYIISDWTIKNLFEYDRKDTIVNLHIPEEKFNSITALKTPVGDYVYTYSLFAQKIFVYKYPDLNNIISEISIPKDIQVISLHCQDEKLLFMLDNKKNFYQIDLASKEKIIFVSSTTMKDIFPIDIYTFNNHIFFLDLENKLYKFTFPQMELVKIVNLTEYFGKEKKFVSLAIDRDVLYLLSEKEKKLYKLPSNVVS